ncbi:hypothetical protein D7Y13_01885 [Corallococcus praedator]|uniref:Uncharacterized protein n=1 Tax=Corallococcus praedator TaxID=2316724 RepID=A0ABX9QRJ6_9BACT|nr:MULTISPECIES: hypothetical protein [Corallococcus]RKH09516.1 hypothetical protein D7X74_29410 [Corallococcus sp. CA047B]RKH34882.1 hypothetical protein D7X75_06740 [Corallococcus sp. CA031C]RKI16715.1 hypothetical protein D7Y13_01885 [Corallococcus praedator]
MIDKVEGVRLRLLSATADGASIIPEEGPGSAGAIYSLRGARPDVDATGQFARAVLFEAKPTSGTGELYRELRLQRQP